MTILSAFRDATAYIERYFTQIDSLACLLSKRGDILSLVLGYGDSTDDTDAHLYEAACSRGVDVLLIEVSHGGQAYGSIEHPTRFKQLAYVGNELLGCVLPSADVVGIVESDLWWEPKTMIALIDHLAEYPAIAPLVMDLEPSNRFRDVYAFRRNGTRFANTEPYHADLNGKVLKVDSAGSVLVMRADLARLVRVSEEDVIVGLCRQIYELGGAVFVDPALKVVHP